MTSEIWIGIVEISYVDSVKPNIREHAFTVITTLSRTSQWRRCARKGCGGIFRVDSARGKRYHSPTCGHLALVKRNYEEKKAKERKGKKGRKT